MKWLRTFKVPNEFIRETKTISYFIRESLDQIPAIYKCIKTELRIFEDGDDFRYDLSTLHIVQIGYKTARIMKKRKPDHGKRLIRYMLFKYKPGGMKGITLKLHDNG